MKKLFFLLFVGILFAGNNALAHKTAYGNAIRVPANGYPYKVTCPSANATCYTIYDNGTIDVFYETGTVSGTVHKVVNAETQETVAYETMPEVIQPGMYEIYMK